jgi:hypothetical protein
VLSCAGAYLFCPLTNNNPHGGDSGKIFEKILKIFFMRRFSAVFRRSGFLIWTTPITNISCEIRRSCTGAVIARRPQKKKTTEEAVYGSAVVKRSLRMSVQYGCVYRVIFLWFFCC